MRRRAGTHGEVAGGTETALKQAGTGVRPVTWWALACCGLIPILLPSAWLIAEALQPPSYDPIRQTVSVLAGHAAEHRWIVTVALIAVGLCYFAAAAGLSVVRLRARVGLVVSGVAAIGVALCPEPVVGSTAQHMVFTTIGATSIALWPALTVQQNSPASVLVSTPVAAAATVVFLVMLGWLYVEAHGGDALGLVERLDSSVQIAWPFLVAVTLRGRRGGGIARGRAPLTD